MLRILFTQDFADGGKLYRTLLKRVVQLIRELPRVSDANEHMAELQKTHDLSGIFAEIESEVRSKSIFPPRNSTLESVNRKIVEAGASPKARGKAKKRRRAT